MKHHTLAAIAAAAALVACDRSSDREADPAARIAAESDQALVRIIHAMPQAPQADVYTGSEKAFTGVKFGTVTAYKPVAEEQFTLSLRPAGQPEGPILIEAKEGVDRGRRYTILAMPDRDGAAKIDVVTDELETPAAGKALVRVIHAAPEAGSVDVIAAATPDDPVIDGVDYGAPSRYEEVDPADLSVRVEFRSMEPARGGKERAPAVVDRTAIEAGKVYTLVVAPSDTPEQQVRIIKVEDPVTAAPAAARQPETAAPANGGERK